MLYTNDCSVTSPNRYFTKLSDDTALLKLLFNDEVGHGPVLNNFVEWSDKSYLCLKATKSKDMCIEFRKYAQYQTSTVIHDKKIRGIVDEYNYLGTTIDNRLKWDRHCSVTYKKCHQRLHCLRKPRSFNADSTIMSMFVCPWFNIFYICWFGNVSQKYRNNFQRIVNIST